MNEEEIRQNNNKKMIIIIIVAAVLVLIATAACVFVFMNLDRWRLKKAVDRLSGDWAEAQEQVMSAKDAAALAEAILYGNTHTDLAVNIGGFSTGTVGLDGLVGDVDLTVGLDGEIDRDAAQKKMSAKTSLSVMNFGLADVQLNLNGDTLSVFVPSMMEHVYDQDVTGYDIFPEKEKRDLLDIADGIKDRAGTEVLIKRLWKNADIKCEKDENKNHIYIVKYKEEDLQALADHLYKDEDPVDMPGIELIFTTDTENEIRSIATAYPIDAEGNSIGFAINLTGEEIPLNTSSVEIKDYMTGMTAKTGIDRHGSDMDVKFSATDKDGNELLAAEATLTPEYDKDTGTLKLKYDDMKIDTDFLKGIRSSGHLTVRADAGKIAEDPAAEHTTDINVIAGEIMVKALKEFGNLLF